MYRGVLTDKYGDENISARPSDEKGWSLIFIKRTLKRVPPVWRCLKTFRRVCDELTHCVCGYRFLRKRDLLIVSGGGQLDEEWGGPWGHPFTLFKWAVLARIARVPYAIASVGACKVSSAVSRLFVSTALRMAQYRSYRDKNSREIAARLLSRAAGDSIVPDMAFSLPLSVFPSPEGIRSISQGRTVVAISPIAYAKPGIWPCPNQALHERYLQQMTGVVARLLERGYFLVIVWSALGDDVCVMPELLDRLDDKSRGLVARQMHVPRVRTWKDLVASLRRLISSLPAACTARFLASLLRHPRSPFLSIPRSTGRCRTLAKLTISCISTTLRGKT